MAATATNTCSHSVRLERERPPEARGGLHACFGQRGRVAAETRIAVDRGQELDAVDGVDRRVVPRHHRGRAWHVVQQGDLAERVATSERVDTHAAVDDLEVAVRDHVEAIAWVSLAAHGL